MGYRSNIFSLNGGQDQHLKTMDAETKRKREREAEKDGKRNRERERDRERQREMEGKRETETETKRMSSERKGGKIKREMKEEEREL